MGCVHLAIRVEGGDTRGDGTGREGVFDIGRGKELATSCVSYCSYAVKATRVVLMLFSEMFYLSVSLWRWCCRYPKTSATSWGMSKSNNIWRVDFSEG